MNDAPYLKIINSTRDMYKEDQTQKRTSILLCGETGTGKTFFLRTCIKPVWIDSFDPGGSTCLREYIEKGEIIVDSRFEREDPMRPKAFDLWRKEMAARTKAGLWPHIGTYCIDGATTWAEAIMNWVQQSSGRAGEAPKFTHDYVPQKTQIRNWIRAIMKDVPSFFVLIGHLESFEDQVSGRLSYRFMTTGKGTVTIPLLFDEIWIATAKKKASGIVYQLLTKSTGEYVARSRLAEEGRLDAYEVPDMKKILKKVNLPTEDKPLLKEIKS
jgi:hypothetical protein